MFAQPGSQRDISIDGVVGAVGGEAVAEYLPPNRIELREQVRDRHRVFRAEPAVAVAVPDHLAGFVPEVRAAGVPDAAIDDDRRTGFHAQRLGTGRVRDAVGRAVDQIDKGRVFMHDVRDQQEFRPSRLGSLASINLVRRRDQSRGRRFIQRVLYDEVAVGLEEVSFVASPPMAQMVAVLADRSGSGDVDFAGAGHSSNLSKIKTVIS